MADFVYLEELCSVLRTKNAGPFLITLDLIFKERPVYQVVKAKDLITREAVARMYGIPLQDVALVEYIDDVKAVKATYKRRLPAGSPGDPDCYGMNQEAPMLYMKFSRETFEGLV